MNLTTRVQTRRVINATAAGTGAVTGAVVDMKGFAGVGFLVGFGAITAGAATSIKV